MYEWESFDSMYDNVDDPLIFIEINQWPID